MMAPMIIGLIVLITNSLVDAYFVSQLGSAPLAAVSYAFPVSFIVGAIAMGLGTGTASLASRLIGGTTTIDGTTGGFTVSIDKNQNAANDAFEDGSIGGSVATDIGGIGTVTASGHLTSADVKTIGLSVTSGIFTAAWDKVGSADGALSLKAVVEF